MPILTYTEFLEAYLAIERAERAAFDVADAAFQECCNRAKAKYDAKLRGLPPPHNPAEEAARKAAADAAYAQFVSETDECGEVRVERYRAISSQYGQQLAEGRASSARWSR